VTRGRVSAFAATRGNLCRVRCRHYVAQLRLSALRRALVQKDSAPSPHAVPDGDVPFADLVARRTPALAERGAPTWVVSIPVEQGGLTGSAQAP
jgi:hypothetical protein